MKNFLLILFIVGLVGCLPTKSLSPEQTLAGDWHGEFREKKNPDEWHEWVVHRTDYGTFNIHFKFYTGKFLVKWYKEYGTWKYDNGYYQADTIKLEDEKGFFYPKTADQIYHARYQILNLSNRSFEYKDVKSGDVFQVKRIPTDYKF